MMPCHLNIIPILLEHLIGVLQYDGTRTLRHGYCFFLFRLCGPAYGQSRNEQHQERNYERDISSHISSFTHGITRVALVKH
jgi:hypothetical protein